MTPELEAIVSRCREKLAGLGLRADEVPDEVVEACVSDPDPLATAIGRAIIGLGSWSPPLPMRKSDAHIEIHVRDGWRSDVWFMAHVVTPWGIERTRGVGTPFIDSTDLVSSRDPAKLVADHLTRSAEGHIDQAMRDGHLRESGYEQVAGRMDRRAFGRSVTPEDMSLMTLEGTGHIQRLEDGRRTTRTEPIRWTFSTDDGAIPDGRLSGYVRAGLITEADRRRIVAYRASLDARFPGRDSIVIEMDRHGYLSSPGLDVEIPF